eukprot:COSAG01_NODE_11852_length_1847_cov_2.978261_1_plen_543_part_10
MHMPPQGQSTAVVPPVAAAAPPSLSALPTGVVKESDDPFLFEHMPPTPQEPVLLVPPQRVSEVMGLLRAWLPQRWHIGGRYGSRIRSVPGEVRRGVPVTEAVLAEMSLLAQQASRNSGLRALNEAVASGEMCIVWLPPQPSGRYSRCHARRGTAAMPPAGASGAGESRIVCAPDECTTLRQHHASIAHILAHIGCDFSAAHGQDAEEPARASVHGHTFRFAELFAGVGGFRLALEALGGQCVFASEINPHCIRAYQLNYEESRLHGDILGVDAADIADHDILVGGFPCQPYSRCGLQPGFDDRKRGHLYMEIVRILKVKQPRAFLLENVPGLQDCDDGRALRVIRDAFELDGLYTVHVETVNARLLTAQNRNRLYFVGVLRCDDAPAFRFPFIPDLGLRFSDVVQADIELLREKGACDRLQDYYTVTDEQFLRLCPSSSGGGANRFLLRSLAWHDKTCDPLISHYGRSVSRGNSQLVPRAWPFNPRRFTIRECARLMGFPEKFRLMEPTAGQSVESLIFEHYRMLGNAVCPPVIAVLAGALLS